MHLEKVFSAQCHLPETFCLLPWDTAQGALFPLCLDRHWLMQIIAWILAPHSHGWLGQQKMENQSFLETPGQPLEEPWCVVAETPEHLAEHEWSCSTHISERNHVDALCYLEYFSEYLMILLFSVDWALRRISFFLW